MRYSILYIIQINLKEDQMKKCLVILFIFISIGSFADVSKYLGGTWKVSLLSDNQVTSEGIGKFLNNSFEYTYNFRGSKRTTYYNYIPSSDENMIVLGISFMPLSYMDVQVINKNEIYLRPQDPNNNSAYRLERLK